MNYERLYNSIIEKYKKLNLQKDGDIYVESHHIIPRSMNGPNTEDNLVNLPAREHYIAHWLLYKIYQNKEMSCAWYSMSMKSKFTEGRYTSHSFAYAREAWIKYNKGENHYNYGRNLSEDHKRKISESLMGGTSGMKGKRHSKETKRKLSKALKGRPGKPHSEETRKRISENPNCAKPIYRWIIKFNDVIHVIDRSLMNYCKQIGIAYPLIYDALRRSNTSEEMKNKDMVISGYVKRGKYKGLEVIRQPL